MGKESSFLMIDQGLGQLVERFSLRAVSYTKPMITGEDFFKVITPVERDKRRRFLMGINEDGQSIFMIMIGDDSATHREVFDALPKNIQKKILYLDLLKNIGEYCMDTNHTKYIGVGVFTLVIPRVFLLKQKHSRLCNNHNQYSFHQNLKANCRVTFCIIQ